MSLLMRFGKSWNRNAETSTPLQNCRTSILHLLLFQLKFQHSKFSSAKRALSNADLPSFRRTLRIASASLDESFLFSARQVYLMKLSF